MTPNQYKRKFMKIIKEELFAEKQAHWIKMNGRKPWRHGKHISEAAIYKKFYEELLGKDLTCDWIPIPGGRFDPNPIHTAKIYDFNTYRFSQGASK